MKEQNLIDLARNGEASAFRKLVDQNKQKIYYLALNLTGNHHDAEDLSQDVFIKAYRSLDQFRGEAGFSSWLFRIAVNTNINSSRKKMAKAMRKSEDIDNVKNRFQTKDGQADPEKQTSGAMIRQHVDSALEKLSIKERCVFVLKHYEDVPVNDIAEIMSVSTGTVKSTLFRAIRKLRDELSFYRKELGER